MSLRTSDRVFYAGMALLAAGIVLVGFGPTFYFNHYYAQRVLTPLVVTHGIAFSLWRALLGAQSLLVSGGRTDIHRQLGMVGGFLSALMVMLGFTTAIMLAKRSLGTPWEMRELTFLAIPFGAMVEFSTLVIKFSGDLMVSDNQLWVVTNWDAKIQSSTFSTSSPNQASIAYTQGQLAPS